jgi:sporulation protein YlmC with PRC-barrel domain
MPKRHTLENLHPGATVRTSDGEDAGKLHAIVLDPRDNEVTHIVVNAGPHFPEPGFGSPRLLDVPIGLMESATDEDVLLSCDRAALEEMPPYAEQSFFEAPRERTKEPGGGGNLLWNTGLAIAASLSSLLTGIAVPAEHFRRARFERHILNDAPVWREEPHTHIGDVERVLVDEERDEIQALVVRRGVLFPHDVVLPIGYVTEILDGLIHVRITDDEIEKLARFEG